MRVKTGGAPAWRASRIREARQRARDMARASDAWLARTPWYGVLGTLWMLFFGTGTMLLALPWHMAGQAFLGFEMAFMTCAGGALAWVAQWRARRSR